MKRRTLLEDNLRAEARRKLGPTPAWQTRAAAGGLFALLDLAWWVDEAIRPSDGRLITALVWAMVSAATLFSAWRAHSRTPPPTLGDHEKL